MTLMNISLQFVISYTPHGFMEASYHTEIICSSEFGNESLGLLLLSDLIQKER